MAISELTLKT